MHGFLELFQTPVSIVMSFLSCHYFFSLLHKLQVNINLPVCHFEFDPTVAMVTLYIFKILNDTP